MCMYSMTMCGMMGMCYGYTSYNTFALSISVSQLIPITTCFSITVFLQIIYKYDHMYILFVIYALPRNLSVQLSN